MSRASIDQDKKAKSSKSNAGSEIHVVKTLSDLGKKTSVEDLKENGYDIRNKLGEGSYCKVKVASHKGQDMAVKIITIRKLSVDFETKFLPREIEVLTQVRHENIIRVFKIFSYPKRVYMFTELVLDGDLLARIRNFGRMTDGDASFFFGQMVNALRYLHGKNIAHRDLKCENIMITEKDVVKLIDFGFARYTVDETGKRQLSRTFCGSMAYAAPEVLQGESYNPMLYDVWSLGCVLFIMVTATMPFDDGNVRRMVDRQMKRLIKYPTTFKVSKPARKLISSMLEPDVTRRANIRMISQNSWVHQSRSGRVRKSREEELSAESEMHATDSVCRGTQTEGRFWNWLGLSKKAT